MLANDARQKDTQALPLLRAGGYLAHGRPQGRRRRPELLDAGADLRESPNTLADGPVFGAYLYNAMWSNLERQLRPGTQPPNGKPISTVGGQIERDGFGNAIGGLRLPELDVPVATYLPNNEVIEALPGCSCRAALVEPVLRPDRQRVPLRPGHTRCALPDPGRLRGPYRKSWICSYTSASCCPRTPRPAQRGHSGRSVACLDCGRAALGPEVDRPRRRAPRLRSAARARHAARALGRVRRAARARRRAHAAGWRSGGSARRCRSTGRRACRCSCCPFSACTARASPRICAARCCPTSIPTSSCSSAAWGSPPRCSSGTSTAASRWA